MPATSLTVTINDGSQKTGLLVINYLYPNAGSYDALVAAKIANPSVPIVAAINPASGPGNFQNPDYTGGINYMRRYGIVVIGYVATTFGNKPLPTVMNEIDLWKQFYPQIQGIFFDEMNNVTGYESYYSAMSAYAKSKGFTFTVGNPGADVPQSFVGTVDTIIVLEDVIYPTAEFLDGWHSNYLKSNWSFITYGQKTLDLSVVARLKPYVGWLYICDGQLPNPYNSYPSYLSQLVASLL